MAEASPFSSAVANTDEGRKKMLEAIAQAGSAGKKAFEEGQARLDQNRMTALGAAQQNAQATMPGAQINPAELNRANEVFGRYKSNMASNQASSEANLAGTQASGESYFAKLNAAYPLLEQRNIAGQKQQESEIDLALKLARQRAEDAAAADAADKQHEFDVMAQKNKYDMASDAANRAAKAAEGKEATPPTLQELLGLATQSQREAAPIANRANEPVAADPFRFLPKDTARYERNLVGGKPSAETVAARGIVNQPVVDLAHQIGGLLGVDPTKLAGLYGPGTESAAYAAVDRLNKRGTPQAAAADKQLATAAKVNVKDIPAIRKDAAFRLVEGQLSGWIEGGVTKEQFANALRSEPSMKQANGKFKDRTYKLIMAQYGDLFPTIPAANRTTKFEGG